MKALFVLGRLVYGGYFVYNGINHFLNHGMLSGYAGSKSVPKPHVAVSATGVMALSGGLSIVLGFEPEIGAGLILAFLLGVSPQMHNFWAIEDPGQRAADQVNFLKNMALVGAALTFLSIPRPWPVSVAELGSEEESERPRRLAA